MTKARNKNARARVKARKSAQQRSNDLGVYAAVLMLGLFGLLLWYLVGYETFPHAVVGFVLAVLGMVNWFAFAAWRGAKLLGWQQSLARLPLSFAGYGSEGGKPLAAASGQDAARNAAIISTIISLIIVAGLSWLLLPL